MYINTPHAYELRFYNTNIDYMEYKFSHVRYISVVLSNIKEFFYKDNYEFVEFYNCYSKINDYNYLFFTCSKLNLKNLEFKNLNLTGVDFSSSDLSNSSFINSFIENKI